MDKPQISVAAVCIHNILLSDPCETCEGKADDGGWPGHGWRIVEGHTPKPHEDQPQTAIHPEIAALPHLPTDQPTSDNPPPQTESNFGILGHTTRTEHQGTGRVTFEGDLEREQTSILASQMMRATETQLGIASEHIQSVKFLETDGSRTSGQIELTMFEITLSNGKKIRLDSPLMILTTE
jgi:hypothetical protein